jgi:PHD/YefM family antitoxin component YafN of YafNO toxin-antitoxin module
MDFYEGWKAAEWAAFGQVGTFVVALLAAGFAVVQIRQARGLREDVARPDVVVYFELNRASSMHLDLVVRNLGQTVAHDVTFEFKPKLRAAMANPYGYTAEDAHFLRDGIPALPPGMEYRMLFDSGPERFERNDLPKAYEATVKFKDRRRKPIEETYILDLHSFYGYSQTTVKGPHEIAKAVEKLATQAERWTTHNNGLRVYGIDDADYQRRLEEINQARQAEAAQHAEERQAQVESSHSAFVVDLPAPASSDGAAARNGE